MKRYIRASGLSKEEQLNIIMQTNPADDINRSYYTWIRSVDDIKTFQEAYDEDMDGYVSDGGFTEDYSTEDMNRALQTGKITVYSSYPIENGYFVTPSKMEASCYSGDGWIYTAEVDLGDIAWIDVDQGQVATNRDIPYSRIRKG